MTSEMKTVIQKMIEKLTSQLAADNGNLRQVIAVFLTGSAGRKMATEQSDLDLLFLIKETKYDLLTDVRLEKQYRFGDQNIINDLVKALNLNLKASTCDIKFMGLRHFYKELCKMNPNIIDAVNRDPIYLRNKLLPNWLKNKQNQNVSENLVVKLRQLDYWHLNQLGYVSAVLGMSNGILNSLLKGKDLKQVDLPNYFIKELLPHLTDDCKQINYNVVSKYNYHLVREKQNLDPDALRQDAINDVKSEINYLRQLHDALLSRRQDVTFRSQEEKIHHKVTDLFLQYL